MFHGILNIPEINYRYVLNSEHRLLYGRRALTTAFVWKKSFNNSFCMEEEL